MNELTSKIDAYVQGRMLPEQREAFEADMAQDEFLKEAVEGYQVLGHAEVSSALEENSPFQQRRTPIWWIAASALLLLGVSSFWLLSREEVVKDQLAVVTEEVSESESSEVVVSSKTPEKIERAAPVAPLEIASSDETSVDPVSEVSPVVVPNAARNEVDPQEQSATADNDDEPITAEPVIENDPADVESIPVVVNLAPYMAFTKNSFKFELAKLSGPNAMEMKPKQKEKLEQKVNAGLNALRAMEKKDFEGAQRNIDEYAAVKDHDPQMLMWLACLKNANAGAWEESGTVAMILGSNPTQVGLQGKKLGLEIKEFLASKE